MTEAAEHPPLEAQVIGLAGPIATAFRVRDFDTMSLLLPCWWRWWIDRRCRAVIAQLNGTRLNV